MKNIGFIYTTNEHFEEIIEANELSADKEYLIRIHTCIHNYDNIMPFVKNIHSYLPKSKIIGCSTSAAIVNGKILTDCCMVAITEFQNTSVCTFLSELSDEQHKYISSRELANSIAENVVDNSRLMLTFFSRPYVKVIELVDIINQEIPQLQLIGGFANTNDINAFDMKKKQSFVFNENGVSLDAVACAVLTSEKITIYSDIIYATEPIGREHTITDADNMIIRSVDGKNTVDWYQEMLGIDFTQMNVSEIDRITSIFPLINKKNGNIPCAVFYSPQTEEISAFNDEPNPVMYVLNEAKAGDEIYISYSSSQKYIEICETVCQNLCRYPSEALFGYSCVSRQHYFKNYSKLEMLPFEKTNLCGALLAGEIGNEGLINHYCNYSFSIASIAENNCKLRLNIKELRENSFNISNNQKDIVEYLITNACSASNINQNQRMELEYNLFVDSDTGLNNINKCMFDHNLGLFDKICMISIRNEGLLKAFLSESKFQIHFNRYHDYIMSCIDDERYKCYLYKKTSLIITGTKDIEDEEFINKMSSLQSCLSEFKFAAYLVVSEFSLVLHEDDIIQKAELAHVRMRNKKQRFIIYTSNLGLEQYNASKMKMIMILNDALANDRVIPYFQGIRDNHNKDIKMYEALMRIEDSEGKIYTPYFFMNIAKEYGYYTDISYVMIKKALEIFRDKKEQVAINMNISDIYNYKIVHLVLTFLKNAPRPQNYIFELTETEEITDYQVTYEFVDKIHQAGGKIAIDDFGSGFSNIVNLFKIKSDYIKVDGEIVKNTVADIFASEFLEMIADWAKRHKKEVIAEFVENSEIQDIIEKNNIRFSQGYLYSKPEKRFGV